MIKKLFAEKEVQTLSKNRYVKSVSGKGIPYTDEFKRIFIEENKKGKPPRVILKNVDLM
ncbi:HTH domain-containing protein [Bacillus anthracis]|uniref:HTH domain-containing protein n=1 Tax=Bacillus anthracis TaxID=1392 RepID=UPI000A94CFA5